MDGRARNIHTKECRVPVRTAEEGEVALFSALTPTSHLELARFSTFQSWFSYLSLQGKAVSAPFLPHPSFLPPSSEFFLLQLWIACTEGKIDRGLRVFFVDFCSLFCIYLPYLIDVIGSAGFSAVDYSFAEERGGEEKRERAQYAMGALEFLDLCACCAGACIVVLVL